MKKPYFVYYNTSVVKHDGGINILLQYRQCTSYAFTSNTQQNHHETIFWKIFTTLISELCNMYTSLLDAIIDLEYA